MPFPIRPSASSKMIIMKPLATLLQAILTKSSINPLLMQFYSCCWPLALAWSLVFWVLFFLPEVLKRYSLAMNLRRLLVCCRSAILFWTPCARVSSILMLTVLLPWSTSRLRCSWSRRILLIQMTYVVNLLWMSWNMCPCMILLKRVGALRMRPLSLAILSLLWQPYHFWVWMGDNVF